MRWGTFLAFFTLAIACVGQTTHPSDPMPRSTPQNQTSDQKSAVPPGESSSKDSKIDLSPPKGDDVNHSDADADDNSDVVETKPWNPHKAEKDIEVGDFYAKRKNYQAAISRYREALEYKPKDAVATFRLAQALEANSESAEALRRYQEYLKILPKGEFAPDSLKAIERLKQAPRPGNLP